MPRPLIEIYDNEMHDPKKWKAFLKRVERRVKEANGQAKKQKETTPPVASGDDTISDRFTEAYRYFTQARRREETLQYSNPYSDIYNMAQMYGMTEEPAGPVEGEEEAQLPLDLGENND